MSPSEFVGWIEELFRTLWQVASMLVMGPLRILSDRIAPVMEDME
jgi:hypothetical protein